VLAAVGTEPVLMPQIEYMFIRTSMQITLAI